MQCNPLAGGCETRGRLSGRIFHHSWHAEAGRSWRPLRRNPAMLSWEASPAQQRLAPARGHILETQRPVLCCAGVCRQAEESKSAQRLPAPSCKGACAPCSADTRLRVAAPGPPPADRRTAKVTKDRPACCSKTLWPAKHVQPTTIPLSAAFTAGSGSLEVIGSVLFFLYFFRSCVLHFQGGLIRRCLSLTV